MVTTRLSSGAGSKARRSSRRKDVSLSPEAILPTPEGSSRPTSKSSNNGKAKHKESPERKKSKGSKDKSNDEKKSKSTPKKNVPIKKTTPIKRKISSSNKQNSPNTKKLKYETISEEDIIESNNTKNLINFINQLTGNKQEELFKEYKQMNEKSNLNNSELIDSLYDKVEVQQNTIYDLLQEVKELRKGQRQKNDEDDEDDEEDTTIMETPLKRIENTDLSINSTQLTYESPIRKKRDTKNNKQFTNEPEVINENQLHQELKTIGIIIDMIELLTGLRIINYEEDKTKFYFDVKQVSTSNNDNGINSISIEYKLVILKRFEIEAEVNYIPTFLNDLNDEEEDEDDEDDDDKNFRKSNSETLMEILPNYFCDNLSFPYNTLAQFYTKMNKALNKGVKK